MRFFCHLHKGAPAASTQKQILNKLNAEWSRWDYLLLRNADEIRRTDEKVYEGNLKVVAPSSGRCAEGTFEEDEPLLNLGVALLHPPVRVRLA